MHRGAPRANPFPRKKATRRLCRLGEDASTSDLGLMLKPRFCAASAKKIPAAAAPSEGGVVVGARDFLRDVVDVGSRAVVLVPADFPDGLLLGGS